MGRIGKADKSQMALRKCPFKRVRRVRTDYRDRNPDGTEVLLTRLELHEFPATVRSPQSPQHNQDDRGPGQKISQRNRLAMIIFGRKVRKFHNIASLTASPYFVL